MDIMSDLFDQLPTIKAISLWQPWASLMACGVKRHETRHWSTRYRGLIAIHAAKTLDVAGSPDQLCSAALGPSWAKEVPLGAVVAIGELTDCLPAEPIVRKVTRADLYAGNFSTGRFAWRIDRIRPLREQIPLTGRQGLFNWDVPAGLSELLDEPVDHLTACQRIGWCAPLASASAAR